MKNLYIFLALLFSVKSLNAQTCTSVRGGKIRMYALDSTTSYAVVHKYNFYIYYDAATICGDTIRYTKYSNASLNLQPINGTDINSDGILDGVLINPTTRMCIFQVIDTMPVYGYRTAKIKAGKFVPSINNVANSSSLNLILNYTVCVSPTMGTYNKKSINYTADCIGTNTIGINHQFNPMPINPDLDSVAFALMPFATGATNPGTSGTFSINPTNGKITWNSPSTSGLNNFGIRATEVFFNFALSTYFINGTGESVYQINTSGVLGVNNLFETETKPFVFPNPSNEIIHIVNNNALSDGKKCTIIIYNSEGKLIKQTETDFTSEILINTRDLPEGLYTYEIVSRNSIVQKFNFVIAR